MKAPFQPILTAVRHHARARATRAEPAGLEIDPDIPDIDATARRAIWG